MDPNRVAAYRVLQDIPGAGYVKDDILILSLTEGPGERRICAEFMEVIRWLGRGWVENVEEFQLRRTEESGAGA